MPHGAEQSARQSARFLRHEAPADSVAGKPIREPGGRKVGTLKAVSGPEPAGSDYSIICIGAYPKIGAEYRAIPHGLVVLDADRGGFSCAISELALLSSPVYVGPCDFMNEQWRARLRDHYARVRGSEAEPRV